MPVVNRLRINVFFSTFNQLKIVWSGIGPSFLRAEMEINYIIGARGRYRIFNAVFTGDVFPVSIHQWLPTIIFGAENFDQPNNWKIIRRFQWWNFSIPHKKLNSALGFRQQLKRKFSIHPQTAIKYCKRSTQHRSLSYIPSIMKNKKK